MNHRTCFIVANAIASATIAIFATAMLGGCNLLKDDPPPAPNPGYAQPGQPGYVQPGQPGYVQPGQPGYAQPGQPGYAQPGQPGYAQPQPPVMPQPGVPQPQPVVAPGVPAPPAPATPPTPTAPPAVVQQIPGFVYMPPAVVNIGTPLGELPRCPPSEMEGTPMTVGGFYIHQYPVPGVGKQPYMGVTWDQAKFGCESIGARLCTEVEWERACKGVDNSRYPYGSTWNPSICAVKDKGPTQPNIGAFPGCVTEEGTHDMIGNIWEWTASTFGVPGKGQSDYVLRGGWREFGKTPNRCAHRYHAPGAKSSPRVGYRCCMGPVSPGMVSITLKKAKTKFEFKRMAAGPLRNLKNDFQRVGINWKYKDVMWTNAPYFGSRGGPGPAASNVDEGIHYVSMELQPIWHPVDNSTVHVFNLRYSTKQRPNGEGGALLVFAEKDAQNNLKILAAFDRPNKGDNPMIYAAPVNDFLMNIVVTWYENGQHVGLTGGAEFDCGMVKMKVHGGTSTSAKYLQKAPALFPHMKTLFDLRSN